MLNILSWSDVRRNGFRLTADTNESTSIWVHVNEHKKIEFKELESGLFLVRPDNNENKSRKEISAYSF